MKHCCYGACKSDSRYDATIKFIPFPKPTTSFGKCLRWVRLCGRPGFTLGSVTPYTFICEKHFQKNVVLNPHLNQDLQPFPAHVVVLHCRQDEQKRLPLSTLSPNVTLAKEKSPPNFASSSKFNFEKIRPAKKRRLLFDKATNTDENEKVITLESKYKICSQSVYLRILRSCKVWYKLQLF